MATIYNRNGTWYLQYYHNGQRIRKSVGKSKKYAEWARVDIEQKLEKARAGFIETHISVHTFFKETKIRISRLGDGTRQRYLEILKLFDQWYFRQPNPPKVINDITSNIISNFAESERIRGLAPITINYELDRLHTFFLYYVRKRFIQESPVTDVQYFTVKKKVPRYFSHDEITDLFNAITPRYRPAFTILLYSGIRRNELRFLEWPDVDNGIIRIRPKPHWQPKSEHSIRQIPQHPAVIKAIAERKALNESSQFVVSTRSGKFLGINTLLNTLTRALKAANIQNANVHTFRHTFASHLVEYGVSIYKVSKLLGHHSVKQTEVYAHLAPPEDNSILNCLDFRT